MNGDDYASEKGGRGDTQMTRLEVQPWFKILIHPRQTMRWILSDGSSGDVFLLCYLEGLAFYLVNASSTGVGDDTSAMGILFWGMLSALGYMGLKIYLGGGLLYWTGRWLKGAEEVDGIRAALAWSAMPNIWGLLLWVPAFSFLQEELFTSETPRIAESLPLAVFEFAFRLVLILLNVYSAVLLVPTLAEAQEFSTLRAVANILLTLVVVLIPVALFIGYVVLKASLAL